jgi:arsenite methyltransferase
MGALKRLGLDKISNGGGATYSNAQEQTRSTFQYKWAQRTSYESVSMKEQTEKWLMERYCSGDTQKLSQWLNEGGERKIILDAGCGSGFSSLLFFGQHLNSHDYLGIDISEATEIAKIRFSEHGIRGEFITGDLNEVNLPANSIDLIFSEGVLHHTNDTGQSIKHLATKLKKGGRFLFYVYAKKAPIREFTDDYIRAYLRGLSDEKAWEALKPLTELGKRLGELDTELEITEDIPFLGIKKGKISLQRFFYWNVAKMYYRPELSIEEMNHINFDWYRPLNCHRHTKEEVLGFCSDANLQIEHMDVQEAGITVVSKKK